MDVDRIYCGDCLEALRQFPDNSIDAVVTDPPYGLGEVKDLPGLLRAWLEGEDGSEWQTRGFMGKGWDKVPPPSVWREVLRVMKPGAYILCFAGCRTVDLMGISLRLAGFEDNNLLAWLQGQGFPKATDVGKMIDKAAGAERKVIRPGAGYEASPDGATYGHGLNAGFKPRQLTAPATPEAQRWDGWKYGKQALKPAMEPILLMQKPFEKGLAGYQNVLKWGTGALNIEACRIPTSEPIEMGRGKRKIKNTPVYGVYGSTDRRSFQTKGRFPANVLLDEEAARALDQQSGRRYNQKICGSTLGNQRGVGMLSGVSREVAKFVQNVERLGSGNNITVRYQRDMKSIMSTLIKQMTELRTWLSSHGKSTGGCMANLERIIKSLMELNADDANVVENISRLQGLARDLQELIRDIARLVSANTCVSGEPKIESTGMNITASTGLATPSRFFYVAKASTRERNAGLDERNLHPTVKPIQLMRYLVRLITPPNGVVLDPFCGTGTTCIAAMLEGFHYIGIDFEPKYCEWAEQRIRWYRAHPPQARKKPARERVQEIWLL